jgi:hypothetical protein
MKLRNKMLKLRVFVREAKATKSKSIASMSSSTQVVGKTGDVEGPHLQSETHRSPGIMCL